MRRGEMSYSDIQLGVNFWLLSLQEDKNPKVKSMLTATKKLYLDVQASTNKTLEGGLKIEF